MENSNIMKISVVCIAGAVSVGLIGYCIYFDRKRRSHPNYKKNVLKKRKSTMRQSSSTNGVIDLRDPAMREQFLTSEFENANQKLMEGNMEEAIGHFINFVQFSNNPRASLQMLQRVLPPAIFELLVQTFAAIAKEGGQGIGENTGNGTVTATASAVEVD